MSDLFDKLNVMLRAGLDSLLTNLTPGGEPVAPEKLSPEALTTRSIAELERQIATMRKQIDAALNDEDDLQVRLTKLNTQVTRYDDAADAALQRGEEAEARRLILQMQQQRRLATLLNAEIEEHKAATSEFMVRVNMLEATLVDAKRAQGFATDEPAAKSPDKSPEVVVDLAELGKTATAAVGDMLRTIRERAEAALAPLTTAPAANPTETTEAASGAAAPTSPGTTIKAETPIEPSDAPAVSVKVTVQPSEPPPAPPTAPAAATKKAEDAAVDEDLAKRRSRLSKPD